MRKAAGQPFHLGGLTGGDDLIASAPDSNRHRQVSSRALEADSPTDQAEWSHSSSFTPLTCTFTRMDPCLARHRSSAARHVEAARPPLEPSGSWWSGGRFFVP